MVSVNNTLPTATEKESKHYWEQFYKDFSIKEDSSFCKYVKSKIPRNMQIIDLGCGTGRDTLSFSREGYSTMGVDRSFEAIKKNNDCINVSNKNISFVVLDISEKEKLYDILKKEKNRAKANRNKLLIYTRFFLHSINKENEDILLETLYRTLSSGDIFAAEFRTIEDENSSKVYDNHYRRYIDSDTLLDELQTKYSFKVVDYLKGTGFSIFNGEDPYLARFIVEKK